MFPGSPIHNIMKRMITFEVDRIMKAKLKNGMHWDAEKALMDLLSTGQAAASNGLKETSFNLVENIVPEMALKATLEDLHARNLERRSQAPSFMNASTQRALN